MSTNMAEDSPASRKRAAPALSPATDLKKRKPGTCVELQHAFEGSSLGFFEGGLITIVVGNDRTRFSIHENLLTKRVSPFWNQLLAPAEESASYDVESSRRLFELLHEDVRVFRRFHVWLYTNEIPPSAPSTPAEEDASQKEDQRIVKGIEPAAARWCDEDLVAIWLFGVRHDIRDLFNAALSCLSRQNDSFHRTTSRAAIELAFSYSGPRMMLQNYLAQEAVSRLGAQSIPEDICSYPGAYVSRIIDSAMKHNLHERQGKNTGKKTNAAPSVWNGNLCHFHSHAPGSQSLRGQLPKQVCREYWSDPPEPYLNTDIQDLLSEEKVKILIGPHRFPFIVHKRLLSQASEYFRGSVDGNFAENKNGILELDNEDVHEFGIFVHWLYRRKIEMLDEEGLALLQRRLDSLVVPEERIETGQEASSDATGFSRGDPDDMARAAINCFSASAALRASSESPGISAVRRVQARLLPLYIFADRRAIPSLQNDIMDYIIDKRCIDWPLLSTVPTFILSESCRRLHSRSCLLQYMAEEAAMCWQGEETTLLYEFEQQGVPSPFLFRLLRAMQRRLRDPTGCTPAWCMDICFYHDHVGTKELDQCIQRSQRLRRKLRDEGYRRPGAEAVSGGSGSVSDAG